MRHSTPGSQRCAASRWVKGLLLFLIMGMTSCGSKSPTNHPSSGPTPLPTLQPSFVGLGRQVYLATCQSCHGHDAQGPRYPGLWKRAGYRPPPPQNDKGTAWCYSTKELVRIIRKGLRDPNGRIPDYTMPPFNGVIPTAEMKYIVVYFESLWSPRHRLYHEYRNHVRYAPRHWDREAVRVCSRARKRTRVP